MSHAASMPQTRQRQAGATTSSISPAPCARPGCPVGPAAVNDAIAAVLAAGIGAREDFYWTLHAVFVKRHEHSVLFRRGFLDLLAQARADREVDRDVVAGCNRRSKRKEKPERWQPARRGCAAQGHPTHAEPAQEQVVEIDARFTVSEQRSPARTRTSPR